jgi:hypothetical protein
MTLLQGMTHPDEEGGPTAIVGHRTAAVVGAAMFYVGDTPDHGESDDDQSPANYFAGSTDSLIGGGGSSPQYTNVWPPSSPAAAADSPQPCCDGQGGHHHNYHHQLHNGGHADAAAAAEEEETIKRRLKFFFMNPVEKYAAGGQLPWKLLLQAAKVILVTTQLVVFANMRFVHVNYMSGQTLALQHHFIKVGGEITTDIVDRGRRKPTPKCRLYWSFLFAVVKQFCRF